MPAKAGPMTLLYPKWIAGEQMPTGPITNLVGLKIKAGDSDFWNANEEFHKATGFTYSIGLRGWDRC